MNREHPIRRYERNYFRGWMVALGGKANTSIEKGAYQRNLPQLMFLQVATEFVTIGRMLLPSQPIRLHAEDKLAALRPLDKSRAWNSLDDLLYCTICKNVISGRQIEVVGGTNGLRALSLKCSTPGCFSTPADWILSIKSETVRKIDILFRDNGARTSTTAR
jgi:hypothetical protein